MADLANLKVHLCEIGRRMYERRLVAGNDGNISVRLDDERVLCTPTMICKGRMTPDDLCIVDMRGEQLEGMRRRSSEILLHLEILAARSDVKSVVHCHPLHATAFAIAGEPLPRFVTPESECCLGEVPIAPYETPGTPEFAKTVLPFVQRTNVCLLAHHGSVTYADSLEQAYCLTEMLEAFCETLLIARQIGEPKTLPEHKWAELLAIRLQLGLGPAPGNALSENEEAH